MNFKNLGGQEFFSPIYERRNVYHYEVIREWGTRFRYQVCHILWKKKVKTFPKLK